MSQDLNRLTANFSTLLPVQSQQWGAIAHPPLWAALPQAITARLPWPPGRGLSPPILTWGWLVFAQLAQGLTWRPPLIPQPSSQPPRSEPRAEPMNWQGLGAAIATSMTTLADRLVTGLGQILGPLLAMRQRPVQVIALTEQMTLREVSIANSAVGKGLDAGSWFLNSPQRIISRFERLPLPSQSVVGALKTCW